MRIWIAAAVATLLPFALYLPLLDAAALGPGFPEEPGGRWVALALVSAGGLLLVAAGRALSGGAGPGLAAALAWVTFPTVPDLLASGATLALGVQAGIVAAVAAGAALRRGERPAAPRPVLGLAAGLAAIAFALRPATLPVPSRSALLWQALPLLASVAVLEFARVLVSRSDLSAASRRVLAGGLAVVLAAGALVGQGRVRSWADPPSFWERALAERPRSPASLGASARLRAAAGDLAGAADRLRRFVDAVDSGRGADEIDPRRRGAGAEGAVRAVVALLAAGRADREAVEEALVAAEAFVPRDAAVRRALGEARLSLGEFLEARDCFEFAAKADPSDAEAWAGLARTALATGRGEDALEAATLAAGRRAEEPRFRAILARAFLAVGKDGEALQTLRSALDARPGDPVLRPAYAEAHLRVAERAVSLHQHGHALLLLERALEEVPGHAGCNDLKRALIAEYDAQRPEALRWIEPGPDGSVPLQKWLEFAAWLCRWGRYQEAEEHFREMLRRFDSLAAVHFHYGHEFWEKRRTDEGLQRAVECYRDALSRDASHAEARNRLWQCLRRIGRTEAALEEAARFLAAAPAHPDSFDAERFLESVTRR